MSHIALHIKALKAKCTSFHLFRAYVSPEEHDSMVYAELKAICIKHQSIISFIDKLNMCAKNALLLEFILNSLNITTIVVQILVMENPPAMIFFCVLFCSVQIAQLFLMSWHANEIEFQSMSISDALFQSKWYEQTPKAKKLIHIMMMRCMRPLNVFIGPFYPMSLRTGIATMKAAYSLLALILTLAAEKPQ
ncbi:odorant receptor 49b-like [Anthonomus grandis grandis]|uniref:odorant receptor 49b-like n=1 Tax=Anthonomus grandis grandis TaxID=2921223 RepID=UPI00216527A8|nr:odorant receptor 49b-like [Anthonomus grandis grandis]XP_050300562.1 odorant receptor 49b-like [Anthonomus grandis grandis]XP_050300570.1 odorant receptor 49b-like [Anthonomus grandis grandis]XP_050300578.1 odorant receptor 49b-like [Anthonomus grandis grandis]XP_050300586.1 odorant receptor 49b-like [Anthonomus grandis grandis]